MAHAAPVIVLDEDGRARTVQDPFVGAAPDVPAARSRSPRAAAAQAPTPSPSGPSVPAELDRHLAEGAIDQATHDARRALYDRVVAAEGRLSGARRSELSAVRRTLDDIAAARELIPSRAPALFATLERNLQWWTTGPLLAGGRRLGFTGSELVWQYYPGQGIQLQPLATFGKLNGLWQGRKYDRRLGAMLDELLRLPAERGGGLAWEYYFTFDGGRPPWVSALAQGTAVQALARAATRLGRQAEVIPVAQRALTMFEQPPPAGVAVPDGDGTHYLIYSFAPRLRVLNGFAQAIIGLYDFSELTGDPRARALYEAGDRLARREVPTFDTGAWSLYSRGSSSRESDLSYHRLLREFLAGLCRRTGAQPYCATESHFRTYEAQKPVVALISRRVRGGAVRRVRFSLSKLSRVGVEVSREGRVVLSRPAFAAPRGKRYVEWSVPRRAGTYRVRITAVDLVGNVGQATGTLDVAKPKPKPKKKREPNPKPKRK
jgi:hypothetical protein